MNISVFEKGYEIKSPNAAKVTFGGFLKPASKPEQTEDKFVSRNLFHFLKKRLRSLEEIKAFIEPLSDNERYIGSLPGSWRDKFKPSEIKEKTLKVEKLFSSFAKECHTSSEVDVHDLSRQAKSLSKKLGRILHEKCEVTPVGQGSYGKVFRIRSENEDLALKIFHNNPRQFCIGVHGQTKEVANAAALSDTMKPHQCTKFYCAKMTLPDDNDAFMLTQFIQGEKQKKYSVAKKKNTDNWIYTRFKNEDSTNLGNIINGAIADFGAISYNFSNPAQQDFAKKLYPLMKKGDIEGIKELKEKYADNEDFNKLASKLIKRMERRLSRQLSFMLDLYNDKYTQEELAAYRELGADFSAIGDYDYTGIPQDVIDVMTRFGFNPKCNKE